MPTGTAQRGPPLVPDGVPDQAQTPFNSTYENVSNTFRRATGVTPTLFYEGFEGAETIEERGWTEELLGRTSEPVWNIQHVNDTRRARGERVPLAAAGEGVATVARDDHAYRTFQESRMVTPVIDLRYVLGASGSTGGPYDQPTLASLSKQAYELADRRTPSFGRDVLPFLGDATARPGERGLLDEREGAGLVNLTFYHAWQLAGGDHVWLDVRYKDDRGAWTAWEPLDGDLVYETEVDYGTAYQVSAFCDWYMTNPDGQRQNDVDQLGTWCHDRTRLRVVGGFFFFDFRDGVSGDSTAAAPEYRGLIPVTPSQILEYFLENTNPPPAYYNSRLDAGQGKEDTRTWSGKSQSGFDPNALQIRKAHFTLNRFIGREVQVGFHFLANAAADGERGWYVDEVRVNAAVPDRDWSLVGAGAPEPGDVLAAGTRVRPTVVLGNNGRLPVEDLNVTFRLLTLDGAQLVLEETVPVPRIEGVERRVVGTRLLSDPLPAGGYRIEASVKAAERKGTTPQIDGNVSNNALTWPFAVRSVVSLKADIHVPVEAVMTDLDEPKDDVKVVVTNRGNTNVTGTLNVTVARVSEATGEIVGAAEVLVFETILPAELPYGKDLTVYGSEANFATRLVTWAGAAPGIYRIRAVFEEASGIVVEAPPQDVFVRQTPEEYLGPIEFAHSVRKLAHPEVRPFDVTQAGWRTWGYWAESLDGNACGGTTGPDKARLRAALCPLERTNGGVGTASGNWTWVSTHDDNLQRGFKSDVHGTNLYDEGILEAPLEVGATSLASATDRLYVTFRHHAEFWWPTNDPVLIAAEPTAFRGIFRVVDDDGIPDSPKSNVGNFSTPEGAPEAGRDVKTNADRIRVERIFTQRAEWDKAVVDITAALEGLTGSQKRTVRLQWIVESTPANVIPDWRLSQKQQHAGPPSNPRAGASGASECSGVGSSTCDLLDPVKRWAVDEIHVFPSPATPNPLPAGGIELFGDAQGGDAEPVLKPDPLKPDTFQIDHDATRAKFAGFTDCGHMLDPETGRRYATFEHSTDQASGTQPGEPSETLLASKCRGWERVQMFPYPTMWYLEVDPAARAPTNPAHDETWWLRWGNLQGSSFNQHPSINGDPSPSTDLDIQLGYYSVAQSPSFRLLGAQDAALIFDHWHEFAKNVHRASDPITKDTTVTHSYAMEGGNVWIRGYDRDGRAVVHELLHPSPASDGRYDARVWPTPGIEPDYAYLRGVPEFKTNYSKGGGDAAFARYSADPAAQAGQWERVTFDLARYTSTELRDLDYRLEFHAFAGTLGGTTLTPSSGWRIDNIMVRERRLANDVALASIESPGTLVGPGVTQPVVLRVRNDGVFEQRGVGLEYRILRDGQVVHGPFAARIPYGSPEDALPGLRDTGKPDKNATFPFNVSWTPETEGTYVLEARVNLSDSSLPFTDENPLNDLVRKVIVVKERHDVVLHGPALAPDADVVKPAIGPVGIPRTFHLVVENRGTVPERFLGEAESQFRVDVDVFGEDGRSVLSRPLSRNLREILPGQKVEIELPNAWVPTHSGLYRIVADVVYPSEGGKDDPRDNRRVVKHLVFDVALPGPGSNLTEEFVPDDLSLWGHNASRYATADGWSFTPDLEYPNGLDTTLTLERVLNLHPARSAFLLLNQSYDFERSYDGGRVEASVDGGRTWTTLQPLESGGFERMSTASAFVDDPDRAQYAFTGAGQGVYAFNLGDLPGLHVRTTLLEDDFEDRGLPQLRANLTAGPDRPDPAVPPRFASQPFAATFTPVLAGRAPYVVAVKVEPLTGLNVGRVQVSVDGNIWSNMAPDDSPGVYKLHFPTDVDARSTMVVDPVLSPTCTDNMTAMRPACGGRQVLKPGSIVRFRAYSDADQRNPFRSPAYAWVPGVSARALDEPRETVFKADPGQQVLWSDKSAVICPSDTGTPIVANLAGSSCMGIGNSPSEPTSPVVTKPGAILTTKWLETKVDLTDADPKTPGVLRLEIRDWAGIPRAYRGDTASGLLDNLGADGQNVRLTVTATDGTRIVRPAIVADAPVLEDRYWNWTDRVVLIQGIDWEKIAGQSLTVRLEHVVAAAKTGADPIYIGTDGFTNPRETDEHSPHFGWGIAGARLTASGSNLGGTRILATLTPASYSTPEDIRAAGWRQGADTRYHDSGIKGPFTVQDVDDLFVLTREPFTRGFWQQSSGFEFDRPILGGPPYGYTGRVNHFWEANASRAEFEQTGGAARLMLPVDLKPAVGDTTLTFNTQYHFGTAAFSISNKGGAAGGRVEISVDDGITWQPLTPLPPSTEDFPVWQHAGQVTNTGGPRTNPGPTSTYSGMLYYDTLGVGAASRFVPDTQRDVGAASEFGSPTGDLGVAAPLVFTGATPGAAPHSQQGVEYPPAPGSNSRVRHNHKDWVPVAFDLTPYAGRDVLIGFHASFNTRRASSATHEAFLGQTYNDWWRVDDVRVESEVLQGTDVRLRLRAATDETVGAGGWDIRDMQVLAQKHLMNAGISVVSPTTTEDLRLGENPIAIEVGNRGLTGIEDVRVNVWLNVTGEGAPASRNWSGRLSEFQACTGQVVPSDSSLDAEASVRLCRLAGKGELSLPGHPAAKYRLEVLVDHRDFGRELLVADNRVIREYDGARVLATSEVRAESLVVRPSVTVPRGDREVTATARLKLVGFDRADVASATLKVVGDPTRPFELTLADARTFDTRFLERGETRDLVWDLPAGRVRDLPEGRYTVEVRVETASPTTELVSVATAPLLVTREMRVSPGFLFKETTATATVRQPIAPGYPEPASSSGSGWHFDHRGGCPEHARDQQHDWCTYYEPEKAESEPSPNPAVSMETNADNLNELWKIVDAVPMGAGADAFPESARARGKLFELAGVENPDICVPDPSGGQSQNPPQKCVPRVRGYTLESPTIDVRGMRGLNGDPRIGISFLQRYDFGTEGAYARVLAAAWHWEDQAATGRRGHAIDLNDTNDAAIYEWIEVARYGGASPGYSEFEYTTFTGDVSAALDRARTNDETFDFVKIRIVIYVPPKSRFTGWQIDDVTVGPFAATLRPHQQIPVNDDTDKTYSYILRNGGAYSDEYNVTLRKPSGARIDLPAGWNVTVLDADGAVLDQLGPTPGDSARCAATPGPRRDRIDLAAGEERKLGLKVCIPVGSGSPGRQGFAPIQVTAFSQSIPGVLAASSADLDYTYLNRPNLRILAVRPGADLPVDQPRQVTVEVQNTGTVAACEAAITVLDLQAGEAPVELYAPDGTTPTVGLCRKRPDGVLEGGIPPGEARQFRFIWTPRTTGWHNLSATADPLGEISELAEDDNVVARAVLVRLPSYPDLRVRLTVSDEEPNIGDAVQISAAITNLGGITAHSVNVTMKVGVTDLLGRGPLNEGLLPRIEPGETVYVNKTWRAVFPGKALLYVNALPRDGVLERVETQSNNLVVLPLFVRSQGLDVAAKDVVFEASPGEAKDVGFIVSNNGDTPDTYELTVDAPRGVRASVFHEGRKVTSLSLANKTSTNLTVFLDLPAKLPAGDVPVGLRAVSQNTTQTRVGLVTMSVRAYYGLTLDSTQATGVPGILKVPLRVVNTGNSRDALQVTGGNLPPGWKLVPSTGTVEPYAEGAVDLVLDVPTSTPRGIYEVLARVADAAGVEATAVVGVSILDYQAAVPRLAEPRETVRPQSLIESRVTLANEGNVRSEASLEAAGPAGWTLEVSRPSVVLDPGEKEDVDVRVLVPATAAFGTHEVRLTATSGDPARGGVVKTDVLRVAVSESDLHVLELDYAPRVGIQAGETVNFTAVVRNDGAIGAKAVGLAFYVDDVLAGHETLDGLAAGGERTVSFRWTAVGGEHVVLAILDPGNELREVDEANNARLEIVRVGRQVGILAAAEEAVPMPSFAWVLVAVAAVALAVRVAPKRKE